MDSLNKQDICRLCTNHGNNYHSIFDSNTNLILEKIHNCLPITIHSNDKLPAHICNNCLDALNISNKLRSQSLVADSILRKQLIEAAMEDVKLESDVIDVKNETEEVNVEEWIEFSEEVDDCEISDWICEICKDEFKSADDLHCHKSKKHQGENICIENTEINPNSEENESIESNGPEDPLEIKDASIVGSKSTRNAALKSKVRCDVCNIRIEDKKLMELHVKFHQLRSMFCNRCSNTFPSPYDLYIHTKAVHKIWLTFKMKWFCDNCETITNSVQVLHRHLRQCRRRKFPCKYCDEAFIYKKQLLPHQQRHHYNELIKDPNFKKYKCPLCGKCFLLKELYKRHLSTHQVVKGQMYKCTHCERRLSDIYKLKDHIERIHNTQTLKCSICPKILYNEKNMILHKRKHHPLCCTKCDKHFDDFERLNEHWITVHNKKPPRRDKYACTQCGVSFPLLRLLTDHETIHTGERPYACEFCSRTFRTYSSHWSHQRMHKNPGFYCDHCSDKFLTKRRLEQHISKHQPPEDWQYRCETCILTFPNHARLKRHLARHEDTEILTCEICGKKMLGMFKLKKHKRQKHGISLIGGEAESK